jgi:hypothetical protein
MHPTSQKSTQARGISSIALGKSSSLITETMTDDTEVDLQFANALREKLPYLTRKLILEFQIDLDGTVMQVICLEATCADITHSELNALVGLHVKPEFVDGLPILYAKILEIDPTPSY